MRLIYSILVLLFLAGAANAQLSPDKERFYIELHPGEVEEKVLTLTNIGDTPISSIVNTPVGGNAKDFIFLDTPEQKILDVGDKEEIKIFLAIPPEVKPDDYTGFLYLLDNAPPSMPIVIDFHIKVIKQESYGLSLTINDAKSASTFAKADSPAKFDISIANLGQFRDVAVIDALSVPEGWDAHLVDGENDAYLPYKVPLAPGVSHKMSLEISSQNSGQKDKMTLIATSLGNKSINSTIEATAEFGMAVRGYNVVTDIPERIVVNRTYNSALLVSLDVHERVKVGIITPSDLMAIPLVQEISVNPDMAGTANFTMMADKPGIYPILFKLIDSNGIPMPDEMAQVMAVEPQGTVVLTGEDFLYKTVASLCSPDNITVPVVSVPVGRLSETDKEKLFAYSNVVILGNSSIVSNEAEKELQGTMEVKRIEGDDNCETFWRFASEMWQNGTESIVITGPKDIDFFKAYEKARMQNLPLVVCDSPMNNTTISIIKDMTSRKIKLSKVLAVGAIREDNLKAFEKLGISVEEVTQ